MLTHSRAILWTKITLGLIFFLILVGGVVRSTGSGLGCPDWPKCFGQWVPPTHVDQLPENYKEIYKVAGKEIADFDAFKTWTEYVNRLIGVFIGMAIIGMVIFSFSLRKLSPAFFWGAWASLILVIFQGWVGAVVVSTHLAGYMITIHMFLALVLVCLVLWVLRAGQRAIGSYLPTYLSKRAKLVIWPLFVLSVLQLLLGTQLREAIDLTAKLNPVMPRGDWVFNTGWIFPTHRSFSILLLALQFVLWKEIKDKALLSVFAFTILSGVGLAYLGFPAFLQPIHLLFALGIVTWYFDLALSAKDQKA
jgi:heme a synthase